MKFNLNPQRLDKMEQQWEQEAMTTTPSDEIVGTFCRFRVPDGRWCMARGVNRRFHGEWRCVKHMDPE